MSKLRLASCHDQAVIPLTRECTNDALDLAGIAHVNRSQFPPSDAGRQRLDRGELANAGG
jgi:hypothetical protein